ncbi:MAG: glycosyltransferase [Gammaproteobacteria bacterium]|nr:glycosyltransferase [Gammaproteobacteria bacterium]
MKKVLVIGYVWPEPNSSAAGSHMMSLLRTFRSQGWQVEFATPAQPTDHMFDLSQEHISTQEIRLNCDSFDVYVSDYQPDIVLFDRFMMEEQFARRVEKMCPNAIRILDTEDLQCLRHARHKAVNAGRKMTDADLFSDIAKREIAAIFRSDITLIISSYEMQLLQDKFNLPPQLLLHLPFMVDITNCSNQTLAFSQRQHFMTIGNFRHAPNWDAVVQLRRLWPQIRKRLPDAELHIYGSYPPSKATALHEPKTGFLIKGWADDALTVMEQARVCLAPLRFGAGIKGKLLDAMIMQTPSVTTLIGSEGMHQTEPWPGIVVSELGEFVEAAVQLYSNEQIWTHAQHDATQLLQSRYDRNVHAMALISKIEQIEQTLEQHRLANFTGSMLRHHSMHSTKYMSQWIAAKNSINSV